MIEFKDITIQDKDIITSYTLNSRRRNCDLSFSNLCSWRFLYQTKYAIIDGFLILKFWVEGEPAYMMPIGHGDLKATVKLMIADACASGSKFRLLGVSSFMKADLEEHLPGVFEFTSDRDYTDYIYARTDLATLKGKKFQSKRNHINKFKNTYPNYTYSELRTEHIPECLALEEEWCRANNCDQNVGMGSEREALIYALNHYGELGLNGGILHVDGKIAAFTFGMPINQTHFGVHIEKADTNIEGAYTMINYEFANQIPEKYEFINREEDLGLEGLRKAKLSYHPVMLLEKHMACLKENPCEMIKW